jgi:hypothetical protein
LAHGVLGAMDGVRLFLVHVIIPTDEVRLACCVDGER